MTSAHFNHRLVTRFYFIQLREDHICQGPPLELVGREQCIHSSHIIGVNLLLKVTWD